ncbi:MAG: 4Fe-4S binding protein [Chloroflexota bacterium]|nr:4Fe-4S binding protein [Chloroflexota bacterium]
MHIDKGKCVGCANCVPVCPMGAIHVGADGRATVVVDECVECFTCYRGLSTEHLPGSLIRVLRRLLKLARLRFEPDPDVCPTAAITPDELRWPRTLRREFSDPLERHSSTGMGGRGTAEVKTNELTNRVGEGLAGFVVEFGRPGVGVRLHDVAVATKELARAGVTFETENPVTYLMSDVSAGQLRPEILNEKIMSCIVEFRVELERVPDVLRVVEDVSCRVDTTVAVGVSARCDAHGEDPLKDVLAGQGYKFHRGKVNLGLGRRSNPAAEPTATSRTGGHP